MKKAQYLMVILCLICVSLFLFGCEAKLPEFTGVYVLNGGKYIKVNRVKNLKKKNFNYQNRSGVLGGTDCNVMVEINRDKFVPIDQETFNKKGFLVVQSKEWSDFKLYRVPIDDFLKNNEKRKKIVTNVTYGCGMMGMPISLQGLFSKKEPMEIEIMQARKGENAFIYVPSSPVEKGFYFIDYKVNGQANIGWDPLVIK